MTVLNLPSQSIEKMRSLFCKQSVPLMAGCRVDLFSTLYCRFEATAGRNVPKKSGVCGLSRSPCFINEYLVQPLYNLFVF